MGRSPFARKHTLWMSSVATVVGIAFTVLAYTANPDPAGWNAFYENVVPVGGENDWNLLVQVLAPVVLASGAWYLGEQALARRKFKDLINEESKKEFQRNMDELEETVKKLPKRYEDRFEEKVESFKMKRRP